MKNQVRSQVPGPDAGNETPEPAADPKDPSLVDPKPEPSDSADASIGVAEKKEEDVYTGPGPGTMFTIGLSLFALFVAYFAVENPLKKRIIGTLLAAGVTALSLFYFVSLGVDKAIDLAGGSRFVVEVQPKGSGGVTEDDMAQVREVFQNRLDPNGARGLTMTTIGSNRLELQLPGATEDEREEDERKIEQTAELKIQLIHPEATRGKEILLQRYQQDRFVPTGAQFVEGYGEDPEEIAERRDFIDLNHLPLSGDIVTDAWATPNGIYFQINVRLTSTGGQQMFDLTGKNINRRLAILVDDKCASAPNIRGQFGSEFRITGDFNREEARLLATLLKNPLGNKVEILSKKRVTAEMGAKSVRRGLEAGISGLALTLIFVLIYYNFAGLVATIGLTLNIIVIFGVLSIFNFAISMAGIAGIVLTIGIAIDANVLIYERLREEQRSGKNIRTALDTSYGKAFSAIFDANITTLIAAVVLYTLAVGKIQGFSITLMIGVVGTLFAALLVTRICFNWLTAGENAILKKLPLGTNPFVALIVTMAIGAAGYGGWKAGGGGLDGIWVAAIVVVACVVTYLFIESKVLKNRFSIDLSKSSFDFLGKRRTTMFVSIGLLVVAASVLGYKRTDALAVDLRAGDTLEVFAKDPSATTLTKEAITESLKKLNLEREPKIQEQFELGSSAEEQSFIIELDTGLANAALKQLNADGLNVTGQDDSTSAKSGAENLKASSWALAVALIGIMFYVSMRFESFAFALGAIAALVHDLIIVTGIIVLFGREISLIMVGALLTIAGYSINDTIVVFDRVREGLKTKRGDVRDVMNFCLNQTLARTLLTSLTTLIVVVTLFCFGGATLSDFALTLIIGVLIGTYSSIFVASPIVLWWARKYKLNLRREVLDREQAKISNKATA